MPTSPAASQASPAPTEVPHEPLLEQLGIELDSEAQKRRRVVEFMAARRFLSLTLPAERWCRVLAEELAAAPPLPSRPQPQPAQLTDWLFLGGMEEARDWVKLHDHGITGVVNLAPQACRNEGHHGYAHVNPGLAPQVLVQDALDDGTYPLIDRHLPSVDAFVESIRQKGGRVMVHCHMGINRSATICVAYLMSRHKMRLLDLVRLLVRRRGMVLSNATFVEQLVALAKRLDLLGL